MTNMTKTECDAKKCIGRWIFISAITASFAYTSLMFNIADSKSSKLEGRLSAYEDKIFGLVEKIKDDLSELNANYSGLSSDVENIKNNLNRLELVYD